MAATIPEGADLRLALRMYRSLQEFGYRASLDYIGEAIQRLRDPTEQPVGGPETLIAKWLKEAGLRVGPEQEGGK